MRLLDEQRRLTGLVERAARRALRAARSPYRLTLAQSPAAFARDLRPAALALEGNSTTYHLLACLDGADVAEVERRISEQPEPRHLYESAATEQVRSFLLLAYGLLFEIPAVLEKTGLTAAQPPEDVHTMTRGPFAAASGLYEADLVVDALAGSGTLMADVTRALDFGCSSGRVLRVMQAAYPETEWHGCDPNGPAIAWAAGHLPGIEFFVSPNTPPLPLAEGSLDLVYAISIWSHFAPALGLRWYEEMHRLIRPGGHLVCTTHGLTSLAHDSSSRRRSGDQSAEILRALYRGGSWYSPEFGEEGDWGVVSPDWGSAFLSPEWMLAQLSPRWRVLEFAAGRNQENQDVYVLQRA